MKILGISAYYHDSAACLLDCGRLVAAAQEERFTRKKFDERFPTHAIEFCLREGGLSLDALDAIVFYEKPFQKFDRILETYLAFAPRGYASFRKSFPLWVREKLFMKQELVQELAGLSGADTELIRKKLLFSDHHLSHAASAFYPSPFEEALVLVLDGVGEWSTASVFHGKGEKLEKLKEMRFPHSLGLLYSAFTYYAGFKVNSGEYKLMGLAPYGKPRFAQTIRDHLISIREDGSFELNLKYFDYCTGLKMTNAAFDELFGGPARQIDGPMEDRFKDVAASIQLVTEEVLLKMTRTLAGEHRIRKLCLAGGVALNCVANGKLLKDRAFEDLWIQPSAGDAGGALGAAYVARHLYFGKARNLVAGDSMQGSFLGPSFSNVEIQAELDRVGAGYVHLSENELLSRCAGILSEGGALGWFQGRMEFGPRALGARSIIADPRSPKMQSELNLKIKFRESFRPFAPAVMREELGNWFDLSCESPYMLLVSDVREGKNIPAVTHVDRSARVQTVDREGNPRFHALLSAFQSRTGCPVLVNTSFNVRGEPIVCTPADAFRCFMGTRLDALAIGDYLLLKKDQDSRLAREYHETLEKD